MSDRPDRRTLLETQEFFGLPSPALVEKDWHVVHALAAIHDVEVDGLKLVFGGGTALARAHRLLERMSEDIDLRIVGETAGSRASLKRLRRAVSDRLDAAGFAVEGHVAVQQNDRYVRYDLPYAPIIEGQGVLRPEIKIELSAFPSCRPAVIKSVASFVSEAAGAAPEIPAIACVPIVETAADKFVALARRAGFAFAGLGALDPTLVRHVYDLHRLDGHYDAEDATVIALETMVLEGQTRGDDFPAYQADPKGETLRSVAAMPGHAPFVEGYAKLLDDMVYGAKPEFSVAMTVVHAFAERIRAA